MTPVLLAADFTWFDLIPGYGAFSASTGHLFGNTFIGGQEVHGITHLTLAVFVTAVIVGATAITRASWAKDPNPVIPAAGFNVRNFIETMMDMVLSLGEQILGSRKAARRFMPLIGSLAVYIFFSNILGLIPGFAPPTDNLNITIGPALVVFFATHYYGIKENGLHYFEHFLGPKIGGLPLLAPIMLPIELISHFARPLSLSLRLMGNMMGDHKVLAVFLGLIPLLIPVPIMVLGTIVCTVQTLVFSILSLVYIGLAIEHSEEAH